MLSSPQGLGRGVSRLEAVTVAAKVRSDAAVDLPAADATGPQALHLLMTTSYDGVVHQPGNAFPTIDWVKNPFPAGEGFTLQTRANQSEEIRQMRIAELFRTIVGMLEDDHVVTAIKVQNAIEKSIEKTGIRLIGRKTVAFGDGMIVHLSPEAMEAIQPVQRAALRDIEERLPRRLAKEGWELSSEALHLTAVVDSELSGLTMRVAGTTQEPAFDRSRRRVDSSDRQAEIVRVYQLDAGREWVLSPDRPTLLGRKGTGLDITFDDDWISRLHAALEVARGDDGRVRGVNVTDRGSTHGTYVDGLKLTDGETALAKHGDLITLSSGESNPGHSDTVKLRVIIGETHRAPTQAARSPH